MEDVLRIHTIATTIYFIQVSIKWTIKYHIIFIKLGSIDQNMHKEVDLICWFAVPMTSTYSKSCVLDKVVTVYVVLTRR